MFILILNVFFTTRFLKVAPMRVHFSPEFPPGAGFHGAECALAPCWSREKTGAFSPEAAPACSHSGEECSGVLIAPCWSLEEPVFPHVVSSDEIAPREILLLEEIPG
jgi:hypothetical protein